MTMSQDITEEIKQRAILVRNQLSSLGVQVAIIAFDANKASGNKGVDGVLLSLTVVPLGDETIHRDYADFEEETDNVEACNQLFRMKFPEGLRFLEETRESVLLEGGETNFMDFIEDTLQAFCPEAWVLGENCDGTVRLNVATNTVHVHTVLHTTVQTDQTTELGKNDSRNETVRDVLG